MKIWIMLLLSLFVLPIFSADAQGSTGTLDHDGHERTYALYVPASYDDSTPTPLVTVLHGGGGTGRDMASLLRYRFNELAEQDGFIVVYPDGIEQRWDDGRAVSRYRAHRDGIDDVGFIVALIDALDSTYNLDRDQVFAVGMSNGGMMSFRLACELSDQIAGVGIVTATLSEELHAVCNPTHPLVVVVINGTSDPIIPYHGGTVQVRNLELGDILSTGDTVDFWVEANGCATTPAVDTLDARPLDGTTVVRDTYADCDAGAAVRLYTVENGGHTWPDGLQYLPRAMIGITSREINAADEIWSVFQEYSR